MIDKTADNKAAAVILKPLIKILVWVIALVFGGAAVIRLFEWLRVLPTIFSASQTYSAESIFVTTISMISCLLGVWGAISLIRFKKIAAPCLSIAFVLGILGYYLVALKVANAINFENLPIKVWLFGTCCIVGIWVFRKNGILR